jgi:hypothetical protein
MRRRLSYGPSRSQKEKTMPHKGKGTSYPSTKGHPKPKAQPKPKQAKK